MKGEIRDPYTHDTGETDNRWCKCTECGEAAVNSSHVGVVQPARLFYTRQWIATGSSGRPLVCHHCLCGRLPRVIRAGEWA